MQRYFNTEGQCEPDEHYMVSIDDRIEKIKKLYIDRGKYFVINRGRQYGKTTTLWMLGEYLKEEYLVISLDFQELTTASFQDEDSFVNGFKNCLTDALEKCEGSALSEELRKQCHALLEYQFDMREMFIRLSHICAASAKPVVLMIDEVDSASNNQVFVDFLALLRSYYIARKKTPIFHSVILAGVYDIKNLKRKIRPEEEHQYNSPWNIAAKFDIAMEFSAEQIAGMLQEYENDHRTRMDVCVVAEEIYGYTSGYPYLVSCICKILDESSDLRGVDSEPTGNWSVRGIEEAVKVILSEKTPIFESMIRQMREYPGIRDILYAVLFQGKRISYNPDNQAIDLAHMFGYIVDRDGTVQVANRIFETRLYNVFLSEEELTSVIGGRAGRDKGQFIRDGRLDMDLVLEKFVEYFTDIYSDSDDSFVEKQGRKLFLLFLKPIINGIGNYYIESQTRDERRTDVIIDYRGEQFVVELKIWHGNEYHERGEKQLLDYLDYYHLNKGYMLSFNFNKKKEAGVNRIFIAGRTILEATV